MINPAPIVGYWGWATAANAEASAVATPVACRHLEITEEEAVLLLRDNYGGSFQTLYDKMRRKGYVVVKLSSG